MALTPATGAGESTADTFATLIFAGTFHTARGNTAWGAASTPNQEAAMVRAFDYLCNERRFRYRGTRQTTTQVAPYPRTGSTEEGGLAIPESTIPWRMGVAQCHLALIALTEDIDVALERGGMIASESVGPISVSYMAGATPETIYQKAWGVIEPLLWKSPWRDDMAPYYSEPDDVTPFYPGEWNNPPETTT